MINKLSLGIIVLLMIGLATASSYGYNKVGNQLEISTTTYTGNLTNLSELQDVDTTGAGDLDALVYNSTINTWFAYTISGISDTNETTRVNTMTGADCGAGNYSYGFDASGNIQCREDTTGAGGGGNTTEEMQDAIGGAFNTTLIYDDAGDEMGVNQTWFEAFGESLWSILTWDFDYGDLINVPTHLSNFTDNILWTAGFNTTGDTRWLDGGSDGNASSICNGDTTYLDGNGNCDDISGVYWDECSDAYGCGWWDEGADVPANEISESSIDFDTACTSSQKLYVSGDNLACNDDDVLTEDEVEAYVFDDDNTANLGMGGYNVTNVSYATICNGANCWKLYVNASNYFIIEEI